MGLAHYQMLSEKIDDTKLRVGGEALQTKMISTTFNKTKHHLSGYQIVLVDQLLTPLLSVGKSSSEDGYI